eukprot:Skav229637  [mRNA]  locus=scaffold649:265939:270540:- [translate_table: standard]
MYNTEDSQQLYCSIESSQDSLLRYRVKKGDCLRSIIYRKDPGCSTAPHSGVDSGDKRVAAVQNEAVNDKKSAWLRGLSLEGWGGIAVDGCGSAGRCQDLHAVLPNYSTLYDGMNGIVQAGRPLAVLGPSGCGKTTLLSCLAGEVTRTRCDVTVYLNRSKLRRTVGYVRQDDALHPELTVSEAISFAVALRMPRSSRQACHERVRWTIGRLGLEAVANSKVGGHKFRGISGGERRRTAEYFSEQTPQRNRNVKDLLGGLLDQHPPVSLAVSAWLGQLQVVMSQVWTLGAVCVQFV